MTTAPLPDCFASDAPGPFIWITWDDSTLPASIVTHQITGSVHAAEAILEARDEAGEDWGFPTGTLHVLARNPSYDRTGTIPMDGVEPPAEWIHSTAAVTL